MSTDYYTDNVQNTRNATMQKQMEKMLDNISDRSGYVSVESVKAAFKGTVTVNMDEQACTEALEDLNAYYKAGHSLSPPNAILLTESSGRLEDLGRQRLQTGH